MKNTVLAFDAASSSYSVAVFTDGNVASYTVEKSTLTHSQTLLPTIAERLRDAKVEIRDLDKMIVTAGPGSFTGLKIGIATAKGLAFPNDVPCVPLSTLEAMAYGGKEEGVICCTLDARRKMLYCAFFSCENGKITRLTEDAQLSAKDAAELAKSFGRPLILAGDGSEILAEELSGTDFTVRDGYNVIDARGMLAAAENKEAISSRELLPRYLRKPQAQREREERLKGEAK